MPNRFLCPKCHGQRTVCCAACGGAGKRSLAGIPVDVCKECNGSGHQRCDVCGGSGEIERHGVLEIVLHADGGPIQTAQGALRQK
jgi:DnaJ-class molecular chaperone